MNRLALAAALAGTVGAIGVVASGSADLVPPHRGGQGVTICAGQPDKSLAPSFGGPWRAVWCWSEREGCRTCFERAPR